MTAAFSVGQELGDRFRVVAELGRGGQSVVYLAEDLRLRRRVALKALRRKGVSNEAVQRFRREAETASGLDHPGICTVHELVELTDHLVIVMAYVEGETLERRLSRAREDGDRAWVGSRGRGSARRAADVEGHVEAVRLIERVARAVHVAHGSGVLHRDLKPSNILITPEGLPVIVDFGLAAYEDAASSLTATGEVLGTPAYVSPEQIEGDLARIDRRSDVYALTAVLFECLALRRPFEASDDEGLLRAVLAGRSPPLRHLAPAVTRDLSVVVETGMAVDPDRRYDSALELAEDLRRVRRAEPIRARKAGLLELSWSWIRSNRLPATLVASLVVTLCLGLATSLAALEDNRRALRRSQGLADSLTATFLLAQQEQAAWPGTPGFGVEMDEWLEEATGLLARHTDREEEEGLVDIDARHRSSFRVDLERLEEAIQDVRTRRDQAAALRAHSLTHWEREWAKVIAALSASTVYGPVNLHAQPGLVPLGPDPETRLQEFAHLGSGEVPGRDPETGQLLIGEETAIVLVLLPAGRFVMGARRPDADHPLGSPHTDPNCWPADTEPLHPVEVGAFFFSKYETTQGQWQHITGANPSIIRPGSRRFGVPTDATLAHPVEGVNWLECETVARRVDLVLPTEAQWEYASRAGTTTPWHWGHDEASIADFENVGDEAGRRRMSFTWSTEGIDDGFAWHSPVGSFRPNPFGLHDTLGNVMEWCRDPFVEYEQPLAPGDGSRLGAGVGRVYRGGNFGLPASGSTAAVRRWIRPEGLAEYAGVRFARPLR